MRLYVAVLLLAGVVCSTGSMSAACTFTSVLASRDTTGARLTANPSLDQCDSAPSTLPLEVINLYNTNAPSHILTYAQVTYTSGPRAISVNGASKSSGSVIVKAFIDSTVSIRFDAEGDYKFEVGAGGGGPAASAQTFLVKISHFTLSPSQLDMATGSVAANTLNVNTGLSGQPNFRSTLMTNSGGESNANLSFDSLGRITAASYRQSGIFSASASILTFSRAAQITVPPQPLIQVLIGEAQAQNDNAKIGVAGVIRNRLNKSLFGNLRTYNDVVFARNQFSSVETARFINAKLRTTASSVPAYDGALGDASKVFDGRLSIPFGNVIAFGSPGASNTQGAAQLSKLQDELNRNPCRKVSSTTLGFASYWYPQLPGIADQQVVIFSEVDMRDFAFIRQRPSQSGCAVVRQSWGQP